MLMHITVSLYFTQRSTNHKCNKIIAMQCGEYKMTNAKLYVDTMQTLASSSAI